MHFCFPIVENIMAMLLCWFVASSSPKYQFS
nr:MAG TPA: hypothetical protein [Bacteriophage sp.]